MDKKITHYDKPAGGWDALKSTLHHLHEQGILGKGAHTLRRTNQPGGFDCPGCAWPDRNPHATFEFCENGAKAVAAEATAHRVTREFFAAHTVSELATREDHFLEAQGRLTEPLRYDAATDRYVPIDWDDAFELIARELNALASPNEALFYTSGRTSNEAAFLYQLFVREFGTNNLPDCSNMCHEASGVAMGEQIGIGKGTVTLDDFATADAIFVFGQNPGTNHPRMLGELRDAAKRGCRIVVFNPLRERGLERFTSPQSPTEMLTGASTRLASHYYQPRIGGDLAVAKGLAKAVIEMDALDREFIAAHTSGFEAFRADIEAESWAAIETGSGLGEAQLREAAAIYAASPATILTWGMGITQHRHSVATIQMLVDLLLLRGNIGRPGAGACPVRGHSNVQGDRTMGIHEKPSAEFLDRLGARFDFEPPREPGHDVVAAIGAMENGEAKVFFALGGNFAAATPDTARSAAALRRCNLTAHVATKLNRSHLVHGREALILPCLGRTEVDTTADIPAKAGIQPFASGLEELDPGFRRDDGGIRDSVEGRQVGKAQAVTVEDSMSMVHLSAGMNPPASEHLLSEPAIIARLAAATLRASKTPWLELIEDYDRIREHIAAVVEGFEDFNRRVRVPGGFHLRNSAREREWRTIDGRARFLGHPIPPNAADPVAGNTHELLNLTTLRSHDQYNTTIYGFDDRYRGVHGYRRVCFISRSDLDRFGFADGEHVDVVSVWHDGERVAADFLLVEYDIPAGCLASYFPETNALVPLDSYAERARTPTSKSVPVYLRRREPGAGSRER